MASALSTALAADHAAFKRLATNPPATFACMSFPRTRTCPSISPVDRGSCARRRLHTVPQKQGQPRIAANDNFFGSEPPALVRIKVAKQLHLHEQPAHQ